jgi:hypothetical protein
MAYLAIHRFFNDRRGGITSMFALGVPVIAFAIGAAVDYGRAAQVRTKLNAAADAAALAALTPTMLQQSTSAGQTAAVNMFNGQISGVTGLAPDQTNVTVTITSASNNALIRTTTVCYNAATKTMFAGILGVPTLGIGNCATASAQMPPNIDFYLLLDNSPSMSLPATQAGITQMESLTSKQATGGCAFACHQASTNNGDTAGNTCANGTAPTQSGNLYCATSQGAQIDNFQLARNNNITLRLDELNSAVSTLVQTAYSTANSAQFATPPTYRFSVYSMDSLWSIGLTQLMPLTINYVANWTTASDNFGVMEMYSNNNDCANAACSSGTSTPGGDVGTNYDDSLGKLSQASYIPNPGNGTNQSCCSSSPTASRMSRTAAESSKRSTTSATLRAATPREPTGARPSRTAASRSRFCTPTICRSPPIPGTIPMSRRSSRTLVRRFRPAPRPACSMTRRSGPIWARRCPRCSRRWCRAVISPTDQSCGGGVNSYIIITINEAGRLSRKGAGLQIFCQALSSFASFLSKFSLVLSSFSLNGFGGFVEFQ